MIDMTALQTTNMLWRKRPKHKTRREKSSTLQQVCQVLMEKKEKERDGCVLFFLVVPDYKEVIFGDIYEHERWTYAYERCKEPEKTPLPMKQVIDYLDGNSSYLSRGALRHVIRRAFGPMALVNFMLEHGRESFESWYLNVEKVQHAHDWAHKIEKEMQLYEKLFTS